MRRADFSHSHPAARAESLHIHRLRAPAITTPTAFIQTGICRPAMSTSTCVIIRKRCPRQTTAKTVPATRSPKVCDFMLVSSFPGRTGFWRSALVPTSARASFTYITLNYVSRRRNAKADGLPSLNLGYRPVCESADTTECHPRRAQSS